MATKTGFALILLCCTANQSLAQENTFGVLRPAPADARTAIEGDTQPGVIESSCGCNHWCGQRLRMHCPAFADWLFSPCDMSPHHYYYPEAHENYYLRPYHPEALYREYSGSPERKNEHNMYLDDVFVRARKILDKPEEIEPLPPNEIRLPPLPQPPLPQPPGTLPPSPETDPQDDPDPPPTPPQP